MHSPPRSISQKEQVDWKIPPSISNWKNPKGYTIPLDKRLAADGRGLQEVQINDNFAKLSEALYLAEQKAREAVETRARIQHELLNNQKERKEDELRKLAQQARMERVGGNPVALPHDHDQGTIDVPPPPPPGGREREARDSSPPAQRRERNETRGADAEDDEGKQQRDEIREERRRERERERRLEANDTRVGKKSKITRDRDRDVSEQIALGQSNIAAGAGGDTAYDQRLFDQEQGVASGFGGDDDYDLYDKPLFNDKNKGIYKPSASAADDADYGHKVCDCFISPLS
jgi:SNW domain-containing protein 1